MSKEEWERATIEAQKYLEKQEQFPNITKASLASFQIGTCEGCKFSIYLPYEELMMDMTEGTYCTNPEVHKVIRPVLRVADTTPPEAYAPTKPGFGCIHWEEKE